MYDNIIDALKASAESGEVEFSLFTGDTINLTLDTENLEGDQLLMAIAKVEPILIALQQKEQFLFDAIAEEYLEEYNEICHPQNPESKEEFLGKIYLESVNIGTVTPSLFLYYLHENLENFFGDHAIEMLLNFDLEVEYITIVG
ncbi:hypothetical protein EON83_05615 [bacterium]|nr:MAG: hypothetical protein EON83_05615 [bacterium]